MEIMYMAYARPARLLNDPKLVVRVDTCRRPAQNLDLMSLPMELIEQVLTRLDLADTMSLYTTCRAFRDYLLPRLWNKLHLSLGSLDRSQPKLSSSRYKTTRSRSIKIRERALSEFTRWVQSGGCDQALGLVRTLQLDVQFCNTNADDLNRLVTALPAKLSNLERLEIRTVLSGSYSSSVVPWIIDQLQVPTDFELSIDDSCGGGVVVDVASRFLTSVRIISCRDKFSPKEMQHYCATLGENVSNLELIRSYFNLISKIDASWLAPLVSKRVKTLVVDKIEVFSQMGWVPPTIERLKMTGGGGNVTNHLPNLTRLEVVATGESAFWDNQFPNLRSLSIKAATESVPQRLAQFLVNHPTVRTLQLTNLPLNSIRLTPCITSLVVDEPAFAVDPETDTENDDDPGNCVADLAQLATIGSVHHLAVDLERLTLLQFRRAIRILGRITDQPLFVKVLLKRPHRGYLQDEDIYGYCQVDMSRFCSLFPGDDDQFLDGV